MNTSSTTIDTIDNLDTETTNPPALSSSSRKRKILITVAIITFLVVTIAAAAYWWHNRAINPVVLKAVEQQALDNKVEAVQEERKYEPGEKVLVLTEREVNALFHHNTGLGDKVRFELANNAIHARISTELDPDLPFFGGRNLKAKARFKLADQENKPSIILDDLTVWGISLPNAWLADLKGKNLISNLGIHNNNNIASGIEDIKVENGKITIQLAE